MASVALDKKVSLELQEGEAVFLSHKVGHWTGGFFSGGTYNFAITNQRIALVPYKAGKEVITINYEDIDCASITKIQANVHTYFNVYMKEKTKRFGFIPVRVAKKFILSGTYLENLAIGGKELGKELGREMKDFALNLAGGMENQQKEFDIEKDSHIWDKDAAKREARKKTASYWNQYREKAEEKIGGNKKPTPPERAGFLVSTINEIVALVSSN